MNKQEAADFLGISVRTLERHVARGELSVSYTRGSQGRERTFDRGELERFKESQAATTYVARPRVAPVASDGASTALVPVERARALQLTERKERRQLASSEVTITDLAAKLMLTRAEAARLSGLPRTLIKAAIAEGKLNAHLTGAGWRVKRADLETYVRKF
jgi:excisionase family DNA binding protein